MLKFKYAKKEDIPEQYAELYTEVNGEWILTGVEGIKTQADIDRLQEGNRKEREDHKETKAKLNAYSDLGTVEEIQDKLDRFDELEAAAGDKIDDAKINEMVEARIKSRVAPLERKITNLEKDVTERDTKIQDYEAKNTSRAIRDTLREAAVEAKVRDTAVEDVLDIGERCFEVTEDGRVITKDGVGVTPGIDATVWLTEVKNKRAHWWPDSKGMGSGGGDGGYKGGPNPFSHEGWNLTAQGEILKENRTQAEQLAKSAGTTIGGQRPAPRQKAS